MKNHVTKLVGLLSLSLTLAFFSPQQSAADDNDPPGRVARLSFERGPVSFEPGGTEEWVAARINRPMTTGDKLWTDAGAVAEMNTGSAYIRIGANTGFSFMNLSDYATQIQLTEGIILVRVRRLDQNETFEIDTPNLAFSVYQAGAYKVTVNEAGDVTVVQVRQGEGEVTGGGAAYSLHGGDEGRFAGTDGLEANMSSYRFHSDEFENWSSLRDRRIDHSYSSRYVSPDVIGYEDLDENGGWRSSGEYGNVWFPHTTVVGWAPYHNGHWAYIAPWGYTWVDDEPWGFAPFHYGRWVNVEGAWGWVPGPRESEGQAYVRPVYAPALVAWVGGPHFTIGVSVGGGGGYSQGESVGWFPLGPREVYVPSYPVSRTYVNNVNVSNTNVTNTVVNNYYNTTVVNNTSNSTSVNVTNVKFVNQTIPGAVTATTPQAFVSAQSVAKNIVQVNQREIVSAPVRIAAPPVTPSKEAVLGTTAYASAKPPEAVVNRTVVARVAPPAPPVPFAQQQKAIQANAGKPLAGSEIRQMQVQEQQQVQRGQQQQQRAQPGQPAQAPQQAQQVHQPAVRIAPRAQPQIARPAQAQANAGDGPAATPNNQPEQNNRPANQNTQQQLPPQQPQQGNRPGQPGTVAPNPPNNPNAQQQQTNRSEQSQNNNVTRPNTPSSPANRPPNTPDPALEQKHQQELEQLHKQQDQERQRVEQRQQEERKAQLKNAADQQHQQQQQQERKAQLQNAVDQQQQQQAQKNADQQQQQERKAQLQNAADQQRQQQQQQAQKNADQQRQQLDQKHQQELKQVEEKHAQEQQQLNQKHEQEHQQQQSPQPPPQQKRPQERQQPPPPPQKDQEKPKKDPRPPQRG